jgi:hypothetical protein
MKFLKSIMAAALITTAISATGMATTDVDIDGEGNLKVSFKMVQAAFGGRDKLGGAELYDDALVEAVQAVREAVRTSSKASDLSDDTKILDAIKAKLPDDGNSVITVNSKVNGSITKKAELGKINSPAQQAFAAFKAALDKALINLLGLEDPAVTALKVAKGDSGWSEIQDVPVTLKDGSTIKVLKDLADDEAVGAKIGTGNLVDRLKDLPGLATSWKLHKLDTQVKTHQSTIATHVKTIADHEAKLRDAAIAHDTTKAERDAAVRERDALKATYSGKVAVEDAAADFLTRDIPALMKRIERGFAKTTVENGDDAIPVYVSGDVAQTLNNLVTLNAQLATALEAALAAASSSASNPALGGSGGGAAGTDGIPPIPGSAGTVVTDTSGAGDGSSGTTTTTARPSRVGKPVSPSEQTRLAAAYSVAEGNDETGSFFATEKVRRRTDGIFTYTAE